MHTPVIKVIEGGGGGGGGGGGAATTPSPSAAAAQLQAHEPVLPIQDSAMSHLAMGYLGARGSVVVKAMCYKPEGRGFEMQ
jgi:hypothetical protein